MARLSKGKGVQCFNCQKRGHIARECRLPKKGNKEQEHTRKNHERRDQAQYNDEFDSDKGYSTCETVHRANVSVNDKWCIDSGATRSCTGVRESFENLDETHNGTLMTAGKPTSVKGIGTVKTLVGGRRPVRLGNVLYVPGMTGGLLSIHEILQNGIGYSHHPRKGLQFTDEKGQVIAIRKTEGRITYLGWVRNEDSVNTTNSALATTTVDPELLHRRYGHPGRERFQILLETAGFENVSGNIDTCETCVCAKKVKNQNHEAVPRASRALMRIHNDIWGPYKTASQNCRHYLSVIDDYSRFSWVFPIRDRSSDTIHDVMNKWLVWAERHKSRVSGKDHRLLTVRTDNDKEFEALERKWQHEGIEFEFTEPYTPAQNGVAERLNRLLLEIPRRCCLTQTSQPDIGRGQQKLPIISEIVQYK